ncbi:MAG TPA: hypothetical protein VFI73_08720 [Candidatus Nitrosopolaris sp.]|nr:hypothetical protein [Candidatus Nitrosopolaris sp.]
MPYVAAIAIILLAAVPFIDRQEITEKRMKIALLGGLILGASIFVTLLIARYTASQEAHLREEHGGGEGEHTNMSLNHSDLALTAAIKQSKTDKQATHRP